MSENKKVNYIPAKPLKREKRVGIYPPVLFHIPRAPMDFLK